MGKARRFVGAVGVRLSVEAKLELVKFGKRLGHKTFAETIRFALRKWLEGERHAEAVSGGLTRAEIP